MNGKPPRKRATYEDLLKAPEGLVAEVIHGTLVTHPRPAPRHAQGESALQTLLGGPFQYGIGGPGGWWILVEPELHLFGGAEILVPNLGGWRSERMPALPETAFFETVPDWICEVLSPSTAAVDRADKLPIYAAAGVRHAWLADPLLQTLEVLRLEDAAWRLVATYKGNLKVRAEPFDAVELDLALVWKVRA
jgi:hypothetical protein